MDDLPRDPFEALPHYAERLRAEFETMPNALDADTCGQLEHEASALLMSLLAIEESGASRSSDDETEAGPEFQRLERKLDLLLELLSARLFEASAPPERNVQMSAAGARWAPGGPVPPPGSAGIVSIYVHRLLPRALRLPAEVLHDEAGWLRLRFLEVGEGCRELLVRHVFQQHRRHLAGARRAQRTP
jgi:hypothetical protein